MEWVDARRWGCWLLGLLGLLGAGSGQAGGRLEAGWGPAGGSAGGRLGARLGAGWGLAGGWLGLLGRSLSTQQLTCTTHPTSPLPHPLAHTTTTTPAGGWAC
jgi:hypothetical protein